MFKAFIEVTRHFGNSRQAGTCSLNALVISTDVSGYTVMKVYNHNVDTAYELYGNLQKVFFDWPIEEVILDCPDEFLKIFGRKIVWHDAGPECRFYKLRPL